MQTAFAQAAAARFTLRQILIFDALTCAIFGLALVFGATALAGLLALPQALLFWAGAVLFPSAALMGLAARTGHRLLVGTVIAGNAAWVAASLGVAFALTPNALGRAFVLAQATFVVVMTALEWRAANR